jgi:hypothetical protein
VSITSPVSGATIKGTTSIGARFAADSSGTATITKIGINIAGAPSNYTDLLTLGGYRGGASTVGSTNVDASWSSGYFSGSSATFSVDTTAWPAGTYSITVAVLDSNGRSTVSAPVIFSVTGQSSVSLTIESVSTSSTSFSARVSGWSNSVGGDLNLYKSTSANGPWIPIGKFTQSGDLFAFTANLTLGSWVQARFEGSSLLTGSTSNTLQILQQPTSRCAFPSSGKYNVSLKGTCTFSGISGQFSISFQSSWGDSWTTLQNVKVLGKSISLSVNPKSDGTLNLRIVSDGIPGKYSSFTSNTTSTSITGAPQPKRPSATYGTILQRLYYGSYNLGYIENWRVNTVSRIPGAIASYTVADSYDQGCAVWMFKSMAPARALAATWQGSGSYGYDRISGYYWALLYAYNNAEPFPSCYRPALAILRS